MQQDIVTKIREAGIIGAGGAGFPTHVKAGANVDTVLVNGASCEPLLKSDIHLLEKDPDTVIRGLITVMDCVGAAKGIVCVKGRHAATVKAVQECINQLKDARLEVFELGDFYPIGDEQVLVQEVLGRTIPEQGLPLQVGAVVSNVESLLNIARAMEDQPVTHRYLTVLGEVKNPMVLKVPVGTLISEVLEFAGGPTISDFKVVNGGPMMGRVIEDINQPVTKTTTGLIVLPPDHNVVAPKIMSPERLRRITTTICCQCTRCTDLCPRNLLGHSIHPHKLMRVMESQTMETESAKEALLCSECGVCEKFACPMGISPREVNAQIKREFMANRVRWEATTDEYKPNPFRKQRRVPIDRLIQRLDLTKYNVDRPYCGEMTVSSVTIPLHQHIGAPSTCKVSVGDNVQQGDLIGDIPEGALGAQIHASISGVVESITDNAVTIKA
ncbi:4Fe-4S dicluster domain-containing protein [Pseudodesulfovibrio sp. zrk46]|uniref:4Fe-4S dicluster domain-containing protein n=1 Tax=Pseudodesulfovibrio sp. zrk46 TaxID=2725288 RepID=UPI0014495DED|nr:4Fe-4S dicluster domain-containing protein [Pseudodesulfovibrio sp. zrk46]QJB57062.1 electron transport complex protein RnfC [Pseudodesulfovibrio sp. zrk46]